jgi:hypothetical protein
VSAAGTFAWIDEDELFDAYCLTAVVGPSVDQVVHRFKTGWEGSDPRALDAVVDGLPFGDASPGAAGLALERLTGLRVSRTWFDETHSRFDMPSLY